MKSSTINRGYLLLVWTVVLLSPAQLLALDEAGNSPTTFDGWTTAKWALWLILVSAIAYGSIYLLRRLTVPRSGRAISEIIEALGQVQLSPKHTLFLVRVEGRLLVLGATVQSVTALTTIDDPEQVSRIVSLAGRSRARGGWLYRKLAGFTDKNLVNRADKQEHQTSSISSQPGKDEAAEPTGGSWQVIADGQPDLAEKLRTQD